MKYLCLKVLMFYSINFLIGHYVEGSKWILLLSPFSMVGKEYQTNNIYQLHNRRPNKSKTT